MSSTRTNQHDKQQLLRMIPAVHAALESPRGQGLQRRYGRHLTAAALAEAQALIRTFILTAGGGQLKDYVPTLEELLNRAEQYLRRMTGRSLRRVINATGVIIHTNLGRSRLAPAASAAAAEVAVNYSTLEYDLKTGGRGSRHQHLERLLTYLTGAEAGLVVNNNAAAVLLVLSALAAGKEVIVSRGELVEIGGAFRVPDVMAQSGAKLVEVGTTNKTRIEDYERAIGLETAALLKVHTSNYRIIGFSEETPLHELVQLGHQHGLPVLYDLGSGALIDLESWGITGEPTAPGALKAGADLVMFSGDKLLGGPQAGIIVGRRNYVDLCRRHPLARAVRIDKMTAAALEATLLLYLQPERAVSEIPTLRMLLAGLDELRERAQALARDLRRVLPPDVKVEVTEERSYAGGGSLPGVELPTAVVALSMNNKPVQRLEQDLRQAEPPVIARISSNRLLLDLRTIDPTDMEELVQVLARVTVSRP